MTEALAQRVPPHLFSRVTSSDYMASLLPLPAGLLLAGPAGGGVRRPEVLLAGGLLVLAAFAPAVLPRHTRTLERLEDGDGPLLPVEPFVSPRVSAGP